MSFNLEQLLSKDGISAQELDEATQVLEEGLVELRRELAYTTANLRRLEEQKKSVPKAQKSSPIMVDLEQKYTSLAATSKEIQQKTSRSQRLIGEIKQKKETLLQSQSQKQEQHKLNMALGQINSTLFINVIEYPVIKEAKSQLARLSAETRKRLSLIEIVTYALNRLPAMYATNQDDYNHQYDLANGELRPKIIDAVRRAIQTLLFGDPLHDPMPIPEIVFADPGGLLGRLSELFDRKIMQWKEVYSTLQILVPAMAVPEKPEVIAPVVPVTPTPKEPEKSSYGSRRTTDVSSVSAYLKRSKERAAQKALSNMNVNVRSILDDDEYTSDKGEKKGANHAEMLQLHLELYTLKGKLRYINVLEKFVMIATLHLMVGLVSEEVNLIEVAAHALNQFPPMYATSQRGLIFQRQQCESKFPEILEQVRKSYGRVKYTSKVESEPLYFTEFNQQYQETLMTLIQVLNREDLNPFNLVSVIAELVPMKDEDTRIQT